MNGGADGGADCGTKLGGSGAVTSSAGGRPGKSHRGVFGLDGTKPGESSLVAFTGEGPPAGGSLAIGPVDAHPPSAGSGEDGLLTGAVSATAAPSAGMLLIEARLANAFSRAFSWRSWSILRANGWSGGTDSRSPARRSAINS